MSGIATQKSIYPWSNVKYAHLFTSKIFGNETSDCNARGPPDGWNQTASQSRPSQPNPSYLIRSMTKSEDLTSSRKTLVPILLISVPSFSCFPGSAPVPPANTPTQSFVKKREPQHQPATQFIVYIIQRDQLSRRTNQTNSKSCDKSPQPHNANRKPPLK